MQNFYIIEISGKNPKRFIKMLYKLKFNLYDIRYMKDKVAVKVEYIDYIKILKIKTSYQIKIINIIGFNKIRWLYEKYKLFIIMWFSSGLFLIMLSNIIFKINYIDVDPKVKSLIAKELDYNDISIYSFRKNYKDLNQIKNNIKNKYSDDIEWLEIERKGITYNIKAIPRIKNTNNKNNSFSNIIAKKDGIIIKIVATNGEVLKNPGDYAKKGEIIISGIIHNKEEIVNTVSALGDVYAEVWYKISIKHPVKYTILKKTNTTKTKYYFNLLGKKLFYKSNNNYQTISTKYIINNQIFKIIKEKRVKTVETTYSYKEFELQKKIEKIALEKMENKLKNNEEILLQKTLKKDIKDGKMNIEIFFKVKENISEIVNIEKE